MKVERTLGLCLLLPFLVVAAPELAAKRGTAFAKVPKQALVELKATVGKPFSAGLVFVNGKFLDPPYKVERYGTALRINGIQVTNEIIPWTEFLKTQPGARVEKIEAQPSADSTEANSAPATVASMAEQDDADPVVEEQEPETAASSIDDIDDLFDDDPKPKKKDGETMAGKTEVKKAVVENSVVPTPPKAEPAPKPAALKIVFDGEFKHNPTTKKWVEKINKERESIETTLRKGGSCFFGTRYKSVSLDRFPTEMFLSSMPDVMKDNTVFNQFSSAARAKGITFLSELVMRDLFRNRIDCFRLQARAKAIKDAGGTGTTR